MKYLHRNLSVVFLSLLPVLCSAQESPPAPNRGSVLPGFIITLQGDTVRGYLLNINLWLNQKMTFSLQSSGRPGRKGQVHAKRDQGLPGRPKVL